MIKNSKKGADTVLLALFFFPLLYSIWNWIEGFIELTFGFFCVWGGGGVVWSLVQFISLYGKLSLLFYLQFGLLIYK